MKLRFFIIITLSFVSTILAVGDHFPIVQGNSWIFSFGRSSGGWGTVITDSGTVQWYMQQVTYEAVDLGRGTTTVAIRRSYNLYRTIYRPGGRDLEGGSGTAYDSLFMPPKKSVDTLYITGIDQETGITFKGDTCWSFVHFPQASIPAARLSVRDTVVSCMGKAISAAIMDQSSCRSEYDDQEFYITAQDIGPIEYHSHSSPYLMDAFWGEDWKLLSTNVGTSIKPEKKPIAGAGSLRVLKHGKETIFEGFVTKTGKLAGSFYNVNGTLLGKFEIEISSTGFQHIKIPGKFCRGTAPASGPCIIKLMTPDNRGITGKMTNF